MTARLLPNARSVIIDNEMTWPSTGESVADLGWKLRYAPELLTLGDQLTLASIVDAYIQMVHDPKKKRDYVCKCIREAKETP